MALKSLQGVRPQLEILSYHLESQIYWVFLHSPNHFQLAMKLGGKSLGLGVHHPLVKMIGVLKRKASTELAGSFSKSTTTAVAGVPKINSAFGCQLPLDSKTLCLCP